MKARFYIVMAVISLLMTNCSQDETLNQCQNQGSINTLTATIEGASRSSVSDGGEFKWDTNDAIAVGNAEASYTKFSCNDEGEFTSQTAIVPTGYAIYPYNEAYLSLPQSGLPTIILPNEYKYGSTNAPMLATIAEDAKSLEFKHLAGLMCFKVKSVPVGATTFTLTADKGITGEFAPTTQGTSVNEIPFIPAKDDAEESAKSVSITFNTLVNAKDMVFYIPMPVGTYASLTVSITDNNLTKKYSLTSGENVTNEITRGKLLLMPTLVCEDDGLKKAEEGGSIVSMGSEETVALDVNDGDKVVVEMMTTGVEATLELTAPGNSTQGLIISDGSNEDAESGKEASGTLNVSASNVPSLTIDAPTLTVNLTSGGYTTVTATTALQTLVVGSGVTVGTVEIDGGHVIIKDGANVTTIKNNTANTLYVLNKNTSSTPTVSTPEDGKGATVFVSNESELALRVAADNGGNVVLKEDVTLTETLTIVSGKTVTLDLNSHTLSYTSAVQNEAMILNNGTLTIKNGTVTYQYTGAADNTNSTGNYAINNTGKLVVEANINAVAGEEGKKFSHAFYAINTSGETIIKSGKILNNTNNAIRQWVGSETKSSDITVEGGEIEGLRAIWIQLPNSDKTKAPLGNLTIKNGTLTGTAIDGTQDSGYVNAIYAYSYGNQMKNVEINIYNGDIYGDLQLTGGRSGAKVDVEKVTITGGTFHGHNGERVFGVVSWAADDLASEAITITGGTFYHPYPLNYMEGDNGTIDIKLARDLEYADNDSKEDNKLIVVPAGNIVTLDLNGKTISRTSDTPVSMITNNGNLTIKDSSNDSGKIDFTFNGTVNNGVAANTISNRGTLLVEGGEISNTGTVNQIGYAIDNYNGSTLQVDGGTVTASGSSYYDGIRLFCGNNQTTVTVNKGTISSIWAQNTSANDATEVYGTVIINGGTITKTYFENYTTVKVLTSIVDNYDVSIFNSPENSISYNSTTAVDGDYTVYSSVSSSSANE